MYSDGYPYLLCCDSSADAVNEQVTAANISYVNFRPNILVTDTAAPFVEVTDHFSVPFHTILDSIRSISRFHLTYFSVPFSRFLGFIPHSSQFHPTLFHCSIQPCCGSSPLMFRVSLFICICCPRMPGEV